MDPIEENSFNDVWSFLKAIDWTDPWLIGVVITQMSVTLTAILTRKHACLQALLFLTLLGLVFFSENINEVAARNWRSFSRQQYFDSQGMFLSIIFSIPLLLDCLIMICNWVYLSGELMVQIKRAQLRRRVREQSNCSSNNASVCGGAPQLSIQRRTSCRKSQ